MRWIMIGLTILGFALAFVAKSPGMLATGLILGFVGLFGTVFALAADRVAASSRPESAMIDVSDIAEMRKRNATPPTPNVTKVSTPPRADRAR